MVFVAGNERRGNFVEFNMASFRETRELLCIRHAMGFITDVEFFLLYEENKSDNLDFHFEEYPAVSIEKHHITRHEDALCLNVI